ncbi:MAG TPA: hypothetical protein QF753_20920 [Victivallales bacterium]|nr:hypothetical protein [Victivallales bacterium]
MSKQFFSKTNKFTITIFCSISILCFILLALSNVIVAIFDFSPGKAFIAYHHYAIFSIIRLILFISLIMLFALGVITCIHKFIRQQKIKLIFCCLIILLFFIYMNNPFSYIEMGFIGWGILNIIGTVLLIYFLWINYEIP